MVVSWKTGEPIRISRSARLRFGRLRMPERMPVINGILNRCRRRLPFRARASTSSGAMRTAQGLEVEGDGGTSSVSP